MKHGVRYGTYLRALCIALPFVTTGSADPNLDQLFVH
jgi:hypothetical protein